MSDEKLRVAFQRYGRTVIMRVLTQPDNIRGRGVIAADHGFSVASFTHPGLEYNQLSVRGTCRSQDDVMFVYPFLAEDDAREAIARWSKLIRRFNMERAMVASTPELNPFAAETTIAE